MTSTAPSADGGPVSLSALLDEVQQRILPSDSAPNPDGFLFSGNPHETVPRALFGDTRLTPLERNAWQVIRLQLNRDDVTALPTYERLRPFLASIPCGPQASTETVARALILLRLTRWLSLVRHRRDVRTGRIQGNLYVLHDEPLTPWEAMQLDVEYLSLVSHALGHASKAVQRVGWHVLHEATLDPRVQGRSLPSRLQVLARRLAMTTGQDTADGNSASEISAGSTYPQHQPAHASEEGPHSSLRNTTVPASDSEIGTSATGNALLRIPKEERTVRSNHRIDEVRTVPRADTQLHLPERFTQLKSEQQQGALAALRQLDASLQQAVLDEWDARCQRSTVRNPAAYLFGIVQKALRGEFNIWASQARPSSSPAAPPVPVAPSKAKVRTASREVALQHIAEIQGILRDR